MGIKKTARGIIITTKKITIANIEVEVEKKNIKNVNLTVHPPNGRVRIAVPKAVGEEAIRSFLLSRLAWIEKHRLKYKDLESLPKEEYLCGESHFFLGKSYLLKVIHTDRKQKVELCNDHQLELHVRKDSTTAQREKVMTEWYRTQLKKQIPMIITKWEQKMGVSVDAWGVKKMKTRWGTCNPRARRIWINLELVKKDPKCLEYIIVHEMAHLLEKQHNYRFHAYMDQFLPGWKALQAELNGRAASN